MLPSNPGVLAVTCETVGFLSFAFLFSNLLTKLQDSLKVEAVLPNKFGKCLSAAKRADVVLLGGELALLNSSPARTPRLQITPSLGNSQITPKREIFEICRG